jgi:hypothetical protein
MELTAAPAAAPAPVVPQVSAGMQLLQAAVARGASIEELDRLITLKERMEASEARQAYVQAMTAFKQNPPDIIKNQTGNVRPRDDSKAGYSYRYADLAAVCGAIVGALAKVGISHGWTTNQQNGLVSVTCTLTHTLGHQEHTTLTSGIDQSGGKNAIQAIGSAVKYLERYTLLAITGMATQDGEDDDGAGAGGPTPGERAELRSMAQDIRRPKPQYVAASKGKEVPPASEELIEAARAAADKGHGSFGVFWRGRTELERAQLTPMMDDLTERASATQAQQASK